MNLIDNTWDYRAGINTQIHLYVLQFAALQCFEPE